MAVMNTEFFLARRISQRGNSDSKNVMVRIATLTVAISIAVMIVAMAVITGFKSVLTQKLVGFGGHVQVTELSGNTSLETLPILRSTTLEEKVGALTDFGSISPYAIKGGVLKTDEAMQGVVLKGVEADYDWSFFESNLIEGSLPRIVDSIRTKDILISQSLARMLRLGVGDRARMLFVQGDKPPRPDEFKVSGIYSTGFDEMDNVMLLTDIRNVQRLNGWSYDQITGYEINTADFANLDRFAGEVYDIVLEEETQGRQVLMTATIRDQFPNLFDWLKAHNVNAAVIIVIMLLVALLNMISALLIILLERTRMIGVLKALGMTNPSLQKMFLMRSGFIIAKGLLWGNIIGIGLCLLQRYTGAVKLDESAYFIAQVPVELSLWWLAALNIGTLAVILTLLALPTSIISKVKPEKTIRFQ